jgi:hypothetical protein
MPLLFEAADPLVVCAQLAEALPSAATATPQFKALFSTNNFIEFPPLVRFLESAASVALLPRLKMYFL